jgi:hypothetical protein
MNHALSENDNELKNDDTTNFAIKDCYLANSTKQTLYNKGTDTTHTYFVNAAKTTALNVDSDKEECDNAKSFQPQCPIHEFTDGEYGIVVAFPHVFLFGIAYNKNVSNLTQHDCIHLLMQFSAVPATCQMLTFYQFDIQRRHSNTCGMSSHHKAD